MVAWSDIMLIGLSISTKIVKMIQYLCHKEHLEP